MVFVAVLAGSLAAPLLTSAGRDLASGSGSSSGSSNGSSSGSSSSGSSSSGSSSSGSSSSGSSSSAGRPASHGHPDVSPGLEAYTVIPKAGTVLYASLRNLPPFVLLSCVLGALGVPVDEPLGVTDPFSAANKACARITVHRLPDRSGPFSDPPKVHVDDVRLTIRVDRTDHVVVDPSVPNQDPNHVLLSLLAAALIVIAALAIALARRRHRP